MNKVVSVEIARQMFWMDEFAYETLRKYLDQLREQLLTHECASEIVADIELRIAELLYDSSGDGRRVIAGARLEEVIAQIGYIDEVEADLEIPRRTYRDPHQRIIGGVCAGLATRLGVHSLVMRLLFVGLGLVFGLGIVIYLSLWVALEPSNNRNAVLASQGRIQTASGIAASTTPRTQTSWTAQRIAFMPFTLLGILISYAANQFRRHRRGYSIATRNLLAVALILGDLYIGIHVLEFTRSRLYSWTLTALLAISVLYLLILGTAIFLRRFYFARPAYGFNRGLVVASVFPMAALAVATVHINLAHAVDASTSINKEFMLAAPHLTLNFDSSPDPEVFSRPATLAVRSSKHSSRQVSLLIEYAAEGVDAVDASRNLRSIDYAFTFENDTLTVDPFWTLDKDAVRRAQAVHVTVIVPAGIQVESSRSLRVDREGGPLRYTVIADSRTRSRYVSRSGYLDEAGSNLLDHFSENERVLLEQTFCESYFLSESWRCPSNLRQPVFSNERFDRSRRRDEAAVEHVRQILSEKTSEPVATLNLIRRLLASVDAPDSERNAFHRYVQHLLDVRTAPEAVPSQNSG